MPADLHKNQNENNSVEGRKEAAGRAERRAGLAAEGAERDAEAGERSRDGHDHEAEPVRRRQRRRPGHQEGLAPGKGRQPP